MGIFLKGMFHREFYAQIMVLILCFTGQFNTKKINFYITNSYSQMFPPYNPLQPEILLNCAFNFFFVHTWFRFSHSYWFQSFYLICIQNFTFTILLSWLSKQIVCQISHKSGPCDQPKAWAFNFNSTAAHPQTFHQNEVDRKSFNSIEI